MAPLPVIFTLLYLCSVLGDTPDSSHGSFFKFKFPWWSKIVLVLFGILIFLCLLYKCFHPRTVMDQFLKARSFI